MRNEPSIDLTPAEHARLMAYAVQHGLTKEEAARQLASDRITELFVVRKSRGKPGSLRALNRGTP